MFGGADIVGINFSDTTLEAIQVDKSGLAYKLIAWSRIALEPDIISDGKILSLEKLKLAVQKLLLSGQPGPIKAKEVAFSLPESKVFYHVFNFPSGVKGAELDRLIASKVSEVIPIEQEFMVSDFQSADTKSGLLVRYAATYKTIIDDYLKLFNGLNLKPRLVTMESIATAVSCLEPKEPEPVILLDIGARTTIGGLVIGGTLLESVNISLAGEYLTKLLMEKLKLDVVAAETMKIDQGLGETASSEGRQVLEQALEPLIAETQMFINYCQKQYRIVPKQILLAGGTAAMLGLPEYLTQKIVLPVTVAEPRQGFRMHTSKAKSPKFLPALGLAIMGLEQNDKQINFLRQHKKAEIKPVIKAEPEIKTAAPQARIIKTGNKTGSNRTRLILLSVLLIVSAGIFGYFFYRSLRPSQVSKNQRATIYREVNVDFIVSIGGNTSGAGYLAGEQGVEQQSGSYLLDNNYWQRITNNVRNAGQNATDLAVVYQAVQDDLIRRLWRENFDQLFEKNTQANKYLLDYSANYELIKMEPLQETFKLNIPQNVDLTVAFKPIVTDLAAYNQLINQAWQLAYPGVPIPTSVGDHKAVIKLLEGNNYSVSDNIQYSD